MGASKAIFRDTARRSSTEYKIHEVQLLLDFSISFQKKMYMYASAFAVYSQFVIWFYISISVYPAWIGGSVEASAAHAAGITAPTPQPASGHPGTINPLKVSRFTNFRSESTILKVRMQIGVSGLKFFQSSHFAFLLTRRYHTFITSLI